MRAWFTGRREGQKIKTHSRKREASSAGMIWVSTKLVHSSNRKTSTVESIIAISIPKE